MIRGLFASFCIVSCIACDDPPEGEGEGEATGEGEGEATGEGEGEATGEGEGESEGEGEGEAAGEGEGEGEAAGEGEGEGEGAPAGDPEDANGSWGGSVGVGSCPFPLVAGLTGTSVGDGDFVLSITSNDVTDEAFCNFTDGTAFACSDLQFVQEIPGVCASTETIAALVGTLDDDAFAISGQGSRVNIGDGCAGAPPPCGPSQLGSSGTVLR